MKIKIDTEAIETNGLDVGDFAFMLFVRQKKSIEDTISKLVNLGLLSATTPQQIDTENDHWITSKGDETLDSICCMSIKTSNSLRDLAEQLREIFPQGHKTGTRLPWRCNINDVIAKLKAFNTKYKYTNEQIISATRQYVESFGNDLTYMKVLKYFIIKDHESTLADVIENGIEQHAEYDNCRINYD